MKRLHEASPTLALALLALALGGLPAAAGDDPERTREVIVEQIVLDCEGDDCDGEPHRRRVIVVGDDGEVEVLGHGRHRLGAAADHGWLHHGKGAFLGVATTELTSELRRHFGVPEESGLLVARVVDDSAAERAGILVGDILTAIDGRPLTRSGELMRQVLRREPGAAVDLELWRDGTLQTLAVTLGEREPLRRRALLFHCGDDEEHCPQLAELRDFDCGGEGECRVEIDCGGDGCECTVNGEAADCETLPGFGAPGD